MLRRRGTDFERRLRRERRREWMRQAVEKRAADAPARPRLRLSVPARRTLTLLGVAVGLGIAAAAAPSALRLAGDARVFVHDDLLALRTITVEGARRVPAAEIAAATGVVAGASLLDVEPAQVEARLRAHPWIADARVMRLPPSRLVIAVAEKQPAAVATSALQPVAWLVDSRGEAFAPATPEDLDRLPHLRAGGETLAPGRSSERVAEAVALGAALAAGGFAGPAEIELPAAGDPDGLALRIPSTPARVVLGRGDLDAKLARLSRLLAAGLPETGEAEAIDLRFADQAVLRSPALPTGTPSNAAAPGGAPPRPGRSG